MADLINFAGRHARLNLGCNHFQHFGCKAPGNTHAGKL
jgi:hypothetical protein